MTPLDIRTLVYVRSLARKIDRALQALEARLTEPVISDKMTAVRAVGQDSDGTRVGERSQSGAEPCPLSQEEWTW